MTDANSQFFAILTKVGMAKQANADALGVPWKITEMGVGDANNIDPVIPSEGQTKLINEWRRKPLNQLKIDPVNPAVLIAEQIIPADEGGRWIREIGLYDADGDLVAVANCAPSFKPLLSQGSGRTQIVRMNFVVTSAGNIQLKIDPAVVLATRAYVDAAILEVLPKNKVAGTYTRVVVNDRGIVERGDNPVTLAGHGIKDAYTVDEVNALLKQAMAMPVGTVVAFPVNKMPAGFLELDGSVQSAATYPDLYAYLGATFNKGNEGAGNFRLPDTRAEFLRGWDHGRGIDAGRAIGTYQLGTLTAFDSNAPGGASVDIIRGTPAQAQADTYQMADYPNVGTTYTTTGLASAAFPTEGGVTRPRNFAVMWCIKAWSSMVNQGVVDVGALVDEVRKTTGRMLGTRRIRATQVYYSTPGTKRIRVRGGGGGGAGGGAASTAAGRVSAGCGGSAGGYFDTWIGGGFDGVLVTVGLGGVGVLADKGNNGSATSFGAFASAPGGTGGGLGSNVVPPLYLGRTPNSEPGVGGNVAIESGAGGGGAFGFTTSFVVSGEGGASRCGPGGNSISQSQKGADAVSLGSGGGGAVAMPSLPVNLAGGNGADGWVDIEEWA
ncbi:phage tail protein [Pseudomonas sp. stari2]|uniref:phage tail protein n=1 Tax=Pseudomonas sp. Stari2 TaxID=2954814 RepID=UPI00345CBE83